MLRVSTAEGWRSLDPESITKVFRFGGDGHYTHCVIIHRAAAVATRDGLPALLLKMSMRVELAGPPGHEFQPPA